MPILAEAFSVIVRRQAIDTHCPGGFAAFKRDASYLSGKSSRIPVVTKRQRCAGASMKAPAQV